MLLLVLSKQLLKREAESNAFLFLIFKFFYNIKEFGFLFGYQENHRMINFHLFSPDFLLLKTMFYSSSLFIFIFIFLIMTRARLNLGILFLG